MKLSGYSNRLIPFFQPNLVYIYLVVKGLTFDEAMRSSVGDRVQEIVCRRSSVGGRLQVFCRELLQQPCQKSRFPRDRHVQEPTSKQFPPVYINFVQHAPHLYQLRMISFYFSQRLQTRRGNLKRKNHVYFLRLICLFVSIYMLW